MAWPQLLVAFLAGYGLMSLILWIFSGLRRWGHPSPTVSVLVLANDEERRIEGMLRSLQGLWDEGKLSEILIIANGRDKTRAIASRLCGNLPGLCLLEEGTAPAEALSVAKGQALWMLDLAKIPGKVGLGGLSMPGRRLNL